MGNLWFKVTLILFCTCMFFFVIWRFFVIFHNNSKIIPLIIASILAVIITLTFMYSWNSKILDIIWTLSSWIFVLWFLLMIMLLFEYIISIWCKINPRIITWIIVLIFWTGVYFSLHTKITYLDIETDKINQDTKILFVSDIHAENVTKNFHIKKILKAIESENPDFVIIAWDLMNKPNKSYINHFSVFKSVENTPIFAVIGNHDVMGNGTIVNDIPENSWIIFLNNSVTQNNLLNIQVAGIIDKSIWENKSLDEIMNQIDFDNSRNWFTILVTHQPITLEKLEDYTIDLEIAWHTHRGQFFWMRKIAKWMNDYLYWEYKWWDRIAFVSQWIWTRWLPFRLWTQSEMVIINLKKK